MRSINRYIFLLCVAKILFTCPWSVSFGQEVYYNSSPVNDPLKNPAFAGSNRRYRITLLNQRLWTNIPPVFTNSNISFDGPLYIGEEVFGMGLDIAATSTGFTNLRGASSNFRLVYRRQLTGNLRFSKLAFGVNVGIIGSWYHYGILGTPLLGHGAQTNSLFRERVGAGVAWYDRSFWLSAAIDHVTRPVLRYPANNGGPDIELPVPMVYHFNGGYRIRLPIVTKDLYLSPILMLRGDNSHFEPRIQILWTYEFLDLYFGMIHSRTGDLSNPVVSNAGLYGIRIQIKRRITIGAAYFHQLSTLTNGISAGSYDFGITVDLSGRERGLGTSVPWRK